MEDPAAIELQLAQYFSTQADVLVGYLFGSHADDATNLLFQSERVLIF